MVDDKIRCFEYVMHLKMNRKEAVLVFRFFLNIHANNDS